MKALEEPLTRPQARLTEPTTPSGRHDEVQEADHARVPTTQVKTLHGASCESESLWTLPFAWNANANDQICVLEESDEPSLIREEMTGLTVHLRFALSTLAVSAASTAPPWSWSRGREGSGRRPLSGSLRKYPPGAAGFLVPSGCFEALLAAASAPW